jgi:hypothetical protein
LSTVLIFTARLSTAQECGGLQVFLLYDEAGVGAVGILASITKWSLIALRVC